MISIIVPVYNTEKYLVECINSILNQSYKNFELILVDDGSTDNSLAICYEMQKKDVRIKVFHKENSGVSATRNFGINVSKGEYISFCDSDDIVKSNLYAELFECMIKYGVDRVCGGYEYLYENGHTIKSKPRKKDGILNKQELLSMMIDDGTMSGFLFSGVYNSIFKKDIIDKYHIRFNENIRFNEDSLFSFEYAINSNSIYSLQSKSLYMYRQHSESSTKKRQIGNKYNLLHSKLFELNNLYSIPHFEIQMKRRLVTEVLWEVLDISLKDNGLNAIKNIKKCINSADLNNNTNFMNKKEMNKYKRIYLFLINHRMAVTLYFISKKIYPVLSKYIYR